MESLLLHSPSPLSLSQELAEQSLTRKALTSHHNLRTNILIRNRNFYSKIFLIIIIIIPSDRREESRNGDGSFGDGESSDDLRRGFHGTQQELRQGLAGFLFFNL